MTRNRWRWVTAAGVSAALAVTSILGQNVAGAAPSGSRVPGAVSYGYDAAGRLTSVTDTAGVTRTLAYDAVGNLSSTSARVTGTASAAVKPPASLKAKVQSGRVVITGKQLPGKETAKVKIGGLFAVVRETSPTRLVAEIPPGLASGKTAVSVTGEGGTANSWVDLPDQDSPDQDLPDRGARADDPAESDQLPALSAPALPALSAPAGITAIAGQIRDSATGKPLSGVTVSIDGTKALSRRDGRFLLSRIPAGHHELAVDAKSAHGRDYGQYEVGVDALRGRTTAMGWTTWLTPIDTAHAVALPASTTRETVVTSPAIPGMEVHVPAGTTVRDEDGHRITALSITKLPRARQPFPGAPGMPLAWTIQPGGAIVSGPGLRVVYPNLVHQLPGARIDYVDHDADRLGLGWAVYGHGQVTKDGRQIVPDSSTRLHEVYQLGVSYGSPCQGNCPRTGDDGSDGDPVDLQTGLFIMSRTDLAMPDTIPVALTRTYRQNDYIVRSFGLGQNDAFNSFVSPDGAGNYLVQLPDSRTVAFAPTGVSGRYTAQPNPTSLNGATMTTDNHTNFTVQLLNGQALTFGGYTASLISTSDRYGNATTTTRDAAGRVLRVTSPNGRWIALTWGACTVTTQCVAKASDNLGRTVHYAYDSFGRMTSVTDPAGRTTTYAWAGCADSTTCTQITGITDPLGIPFVRNSFDIAGRVTTQLQPDGTAYSFVYTVAGDGHVSATTVTDPRGNQRQVTFDASGYSASSTAAFGTSRAQTTSVVRDSAHQATAVTDALNRTTALSYDGNGNVLTRTRLAGTAGAVTDTFTYEPAYQRIASVTNPLGKKGTFAYDDTNQIVTITDALGHSAKTQISEGQPVAITDALGRTTYLSYLDGQPVAVADPLGRVWKSYYDGAGRLLKTTDPAGGRMQYRYNLLNQPIGTTDALGATSSAAYDAGGRVTSVTDALGNATVYGYDSFGRLTSRRDALGKTGTYSYDPNGNITAHVDRTGTRDVFTYDVLDRLAFTGYKAVTTGTGTTYQSTITNTYDAANRLTSAVDTAGGTLTRTYDALDRISSETTAQGSVSYLYDTASRRTRMTVAGQPATNYAYDSGNRLTGITGAAGSVTIAYDNADRRSSITLPGGVKEAYGYDPAGQLTAITYSTASGALGNLSYSYDAAGRRTGIGGTFARSGLPAAGLTSSYNANNALTSRSGASYTYDAEGQLTSDGTRNYTWNARHQLTGISGGGTTASFSYDPIGRRLTRTVSGATTGFVYDGPNLVQEKSGGSASANLLTGFGADQTFTRTDSAGTRSLLTDALGSTVALTNSTGAVTTSYTYDPYGATVRAGAADSNPMQYTGRENDGTGLYYYRARYYSPSQQRFISQDPAGPAGSGANLYAYAGDDPVNNTDPTGEQLLPGCLIGAAFGVGGGLVGSWLTGNKYTFGDGLKDAAIGCALGAVGAWAGEFFGAAAGVSTGDVAVYRSLNAAGEVQYVGITNSLERRAAEHLAEKGISIEGIPGLSNLSRADAKAVEQVLIEQYGLGKNGGQLLNRINSIASSNSIYESAIQRGRELLQLVGY